MDAQEWRMMHTATTAAPPGVGGLEGTQPSKEQTVPEWRGLTMCRSPREA